MFFCFHSHTTIVGDVHLDFTVCKMCQKKVSHTTENNCDYLCRYVAAPHCPSCQGLFQSWLMEWPEHNREKAALWAFFFLLVQQKWAFLSTFTNSFRCIPHLFGLCPSLAHRLEPSGQTQEPTMHWEVRGCALEPLIFGCGCSHCSPWGFCLRHSVLMRVNEDKLVWV